ncbi:Spy/CpxP family protein refolding chaperone [Corticimicrobacter populi]|uniref:Periplasmic heavy metal sensor n=1 Tax=Corticimicrobacter populi TaxID=2175229 RepID=A0A2V1K3R7_9BURK|nr:Spy/CpxP family protein refolding chaperone [Corticimicrobacter populi]PWF24873.1 hypothetical protein DD235_01450 [Corticimicrobacter populi]
MQSTRNLSRSFRLLGSAAVLALASHAALAQPPAPGQERGRHEAHGASTPHLMAHAGIQGERPLHGMRGLDLSREQEDRIFAIRHASVPDMRNAHLAIRDARRALHELGKADRFDEKQAEQLSTSLAQAIARSEVLRLRTDQQVRAVLTPEQRQQWDERQTRRHGGPDQHEPRHAPPAES